MNDEITYEISAERMEHFRNVEADRSRLGREVAELKAECENLRSQNERLKDDIFDLFLETIE